MGIIYLVTDTKTNKKYVGQTIQKLCNRKAEHRYCKDNNNHFNNLYRKYGDDRFIWKIIYESDDIQDLNEKEIYFIKQYNSLYPNGYNHTSGGKSCFSISEETKKKMKKNHWSKNGYKSPNCKKVINITTGEVFNTINEAANSIGITYAWLSNRIKHNKPIQGYLWKFYEEGVR